MKNFKLKYVQPFKIIFVVLLMVSCDSDDAAIDSNTEIQSPSLSYNEVLNLSKDKAKYNAGEDVNFKVNAVHPNTIIRYKHLGETILEEPLTSTSWSWTPPMDDFKGYMVELVKNTNGDETVLGTVGIDVSSDWTKFPRYGFLSNFGNISDAERNSVLENLKNFHINGLQFYDWHYKHHMPLPIDTNGNAENSWVDLFNREVKLETVDGYINKGHELNMASMFYNLMFGAWHPEEGDGFSDEWLLYNDQLHNNINAHDLGDFGDILVTNPANQEWQNYIFSKTKNVYQNLNFDGWHLDQLGNRGNVYEYGGYQVNLPNAYQDFMMAVTEAFPNKKHVLNAVEQYGQNKILSTPVNFAYSEVWDRVQYADLVEVIMENNQMSNNQLNTVLAAYMNYESSEGSFNTPSVLLTDAVIFAFGGAHLELGEHMLSREYFPYNNLSMDAELKNRLMEYYDFMVAYENLLRDGGSFTLPNVSSSDLGVNNWPPVFGNASVVSKKVEGREVFQMLNFNGVSTLSWRDNAKTQTKPNASQDFEITIASTMPVSKVWFASPDYKGGASQELEFENNQGQITVKVPYLEYWSMLVFEN
ncbi:dextranase [Gelidibacter algens]|uniref:Dextranase n=1 Tax=Gelidibacter algens TaxID=49280 RepID=A0A1A7R1A3_9FLAO|nr:glycoside hydrolase family 66 protein [Gelidibacter algens]OBX26035.1 hypothetical protein A9996_06905 [Gelidibacter algens]RAJ27695.1 dextranase [Gelidibacter algens]